MNSETGAQIRPTSRSTRQRQTRDSAQCDNGDPDRAEGNGRRVGQQADGGGIKGRETRVRRAWLTIPQPVCRNLRLLRSRRRKRRRSAGPEGAGLSSAQPTEFLTTSNCPVSTRDVVEKNGAEHNPADRKQPECRSVSGCSQQDAYRHAVGEQGDERGSRDPCKACLPGGFALPGKEVKQRENRQSRNKSRNPEISCDRCVVVLPHSWSKIVTCGGNLNRIRSA